MECRTNTWANFWLCACGVPWHRCEVHSLDPEVHSEPRLSRKRQAECDAPAQEPMRPPRSRRKDVLRTSPQSCDANADRCDISKDSKPRAQKRSSTEEDRDEKAKRPNQSTGSDQLELRQVPHALPAVVMSQSNSRTFGNVDDAEIATWDINFLRNPCQAIEMTTEEFEKWVEEQGRQHGQHNVDTAETCSMPHAHPTADVPQGSLQSLDRALDDLVEDLLADRGPDDADLGIEVAARNSPHDNMHTREGMPVGSDCEKSHGSTLTCSRPMRRSPCQHDKPSSSSSQVNQ